MIFALYRYLKKVFQSALVSLGLPPHSCRFTPSCSHYCDQALRKYGPLKGSYLCISRLLRCSPLFKGGFDPLP